MTVVLWLSYKDTYTGQIMFRKIHEVRTAVPRIHCLVGSGRQRYKKEKEKRKTHARRVRRTAVSDGRKPSIGGQNWACWDAESELSSITRTQMADRSDQTDRTRMEETLGCWRDVLFRFSQQNRSASARGRICSLVVNTSVEAVLPAAVPVLTSEAETGADVSGLHVGRTDGWRPRLATDRPRQKLARTSPAKSILELSSRRAPRQG